jgi:hypothetical protein
MAAPEIFIGSIGTWLYPRYRIRVEFSRSYRGVVRYLAYSYTETDKDLVNGFYSGYPPASK